MITKDSETKVFAVSEMERVHPHGSISVLAMLAVWLLGWQGQLVGWSVHTLVQSKRSQQILY